MELSNFKEVIDQYEVVFFDAFGVLKNSKGLIPRIEETLIYLESNQKEFYVVTNDASRSPEMLADSYISKGLSMVTPDKIISSGMIAREFLKQKVQDGVVTYLGTPQSEHYLGGLGMKNIPVQELNLDDLEEVHAMVLLDDEGFDWNTHLNHAINVLRRQNMPVILANSDLAYPVSGHDVAIAIGGIAQMLEAVTGKTFMKFGKPDGEMFHFAYEHAMARNPHEKDKFLMVGDTLETDILGGNKFGIDTVLVLTGNTQPKRVDLAIRTTGIIPNYICESAVI